MNRRARGAAIAFSALPLAVSLLAALPLAAPLAAQGVPGEAEKRAPDMRQQEPLREKQEPLDVRQQLPPSADTAEQRPPVGNPVERRSAPEPARAIDPRALPVVKPRTEVLVAPADPAARKKAQALYEEAGRLAAEAAALPEEDPRRVKLLAAAARSYEAVPELYPPATDRVYAELAVLYTSLPEGAGGGAERAEAAFRRAAAGRSASRYASLLGYADFLAARGRWQEAERYYEEVSLARPQNGAADRALMERYLHPEAVGLRPEPELGSLILYLRRLRGAGQEVRSQESALTALEEAAAGRRVAGAAAKRDLLALVVMGFGDGVIPPEAILGRPFGPRLQALETDPDVGTGARELKQLALSIQKAARRGGTLRESYWRRRGRGDEETAWKKVYGTEFPWWSRFREAEGALADPSAGDPIAPLDALRRTMRALGDLYRQEDNTEIAELCYLAASRVGQSGDRVDSSSFRALLDLTIDRRGPEGVEELLDRYEVGLLESKGMAYQRRELEAIYDFHRTLGQLYSYLAREKGRPWTNDRDRVRTPVFQLERAVEVGRMLDDQGGRIGSEPTRGLPAAGSGGSRIDPSLVLNLADGYRRIGRADEADALLLDEARYFQSRKEFAARDRMMQQVDPGRLTAANLDRLEKVVDEQPRVEVRPNEIRYNFAEENKVLRLDLDQDRLRESGTEAEVLERLRHKIESGEIDAERPRGGEVEVEVEGRKYRVPYKVEPVKPPR